MERVKWDKDLEKELLRCVTECAAERGSDATIKISQETKPGCWKGTSLKQIHKTGGNVPRFTHIYAHSLMLHVSSRVLERNQ